MQSKDPFEAALVEEEEEEEAEHESPHSPMAQDDVETQTQTPTPIQTPAPVAAAAALDAVLDEDYDEVGPTTANNPSHPSSSSAAAVNANANVAVAAAAATTATATKSKNKESMDEEEEEENVDVELSKYPSSADPAKMAKMQAILSQFTEDQMSRYESFRRSALQKSNMRRLLVSITGSQKISLPMTIVVCGIAKMFVGELVETARIVMTERKESGPIRPCHIREAYRRLKLEGKIPKRSVQRLFR